MSSEVINLRLARKRKARADADRKATENRVRFGRSKAEKQRDSLLQMEASRRLDQLKREPGSTD